MGNPPQGPTSLQRFELKTAIMRVAQNVHTFKGVLTQRSATLQLTV